MDGQEQVTVRALHLFGVKYDRYRRVDAKKQLISQRVSQTTVRVPYLLGVKYDRFRRMDPKYELTSQRDIQTTVRGTVLVRYEIRQVQTGGPQNRKYFLKGEIKPPFGYVCNQCGATTADARRPEKRTRSKRVIMVA